MKRFYLLAAAISVTGGMAFADPGEEVPDRDGTVLDIQLPQPDRQSQPAIPERLLDDSHMNEELGINEFTAPSIRKIFEDLEGLPEIPENAALRPRPERPPMDRCSLALQLGGMMADGFVIVQCGKMNEVKPAGPLQLREGDRCRRARKPPRRQPAEKCGGRRFGQFQEQPGPDPVRRGAGACLPA